MTSVEYRNLYTKTKGAPTKCGICLSSIVLWSRSAGVIVFGTDYMSVGLQQEEGKKIDERLL
jgi:hypothetical protein